MISRKPVVDDFTPAYLTLPSGELRDRARRAVASLADCRACPRDCGVNRLEGKWAACKTGRYAVVGSYFPHFGEEDCLRGWNGSGTIFFAHCNLRCVFCFHPDTRVVTNRGPVRIREIFEGGELSGSDERVRVPDDTLRVLARTGEWAPVVHAFEHHHSGELVRLKPFNCPPLRLTPNHRVFVVRKSDPDRAIKVEAGELDREEHWLVVPKGSPGDQDLSLDVRSILAEEDRTVKKSASRRVHSEEMVGLFAQRWTSATLSQITGYHPAYLRRLRGEWGRGEFRAGDDELEVSLDLVAEDGLVRFKTERRPGIPSAVRLDERLAWLLGLYCAEGHVTSSKDRPNSHRLVVSCGPHERDRVERVRELLKGIFGVKPTVRQRRTTVTVECGKASLGLLLTKLCGSGAASKKVPPVLLSARASVVEAFLDGVLAGDGCDLDTHRVVNTVSRRLALGLYQLGLNLGILPSYHRWEPPAETVIEGRRVRQRPLHYVKFPKIDPRSGRCRTRWRETEEAFLVPIHRIERQPYEGPVYNLEVGHSDHSYRASFVAVANCQNHEISQDIKPTEAPEGARPEEIADMALELQERGCHNINFVTPEHVVPQVVEAVAEAVDRGLRLPIVYNTSAYDALESLELMEGIVDIFMPDIKYFTAEGSRTYMKAEDYPEAAKAAVKEMHRQVGELVFGDDGLAKRGLIVRHLVMPDGLEETRAILEWVAEELGPDTYVNLMDQYYPSGKVSEERYGEINRKLSGEEFREAKRIARELGLRRLDERDPHPRLRARMAGWM